MRGSGQAFPPDRVEVTETTVSLTKSPALRQAEFGVSEKQDHQEEWNVNRVL
jgi:hypothetical protein